MALNRDRSASTWLAMTCARDGAITHVLRDDLGVAHAAAHGGRLRDVVDSGSAQKADALIAMLAERDCVVGWEMNVPEENRARPFAFAGAVVGKTLLILGTASAEQNHFYEELSRLNNELINRERELARKSATLTRLTAEKARVVAIAAHDLRNPLTIIASYADLLRLEGAVEGEHLAYVEEISRSARFMMELVEEMLESSTLESGHVDLHWQEIDLVNAARHAATVNQIRAERKAIALDFEPETDPAPIRADPVKLRQIINNLVVNAIKFSPGGTKVTIRVRRAGENPAIEVQDQGIGIPREKLSAIFEPFAALSPTGTAGEKSTGLGLAIVKQLAELHRAAVHVESEEGRGSLFRVTFPALR